MSSKTDPGRPSEDRKEARWSRTVRELSFLGHDYFWKFLHNMRKVYYPHCLYCLSVTDTVEQVAYPPSLVGVWDQAFWPGHSLKPNSVGRQPGIWNRVARFVEAALKAKKVLNGPLLRVTTQRVLTTSAPYKFGIYNAKQFQVSPSEMKGIFSGMSLILLVF